METASGVAPAASIAGKIWSKRHAPWRHSGEAGEGGKRSRETERVAIRRAAMGVIRRMSGGPRRRTRDEAGGRAGEPGKSQGVGWDVEVEIGEAMHGDGEERAQEAARQGPVRTAAHEDDC